MSFFDQVPEAPSDPIFGLVAAFKKDPRPEKYSLIIGYYRNEQLKTPVLDCVAEVEKSLAEQKISREYLPIEGDSEFVAEIGKLVFGSHWGKAPIGGVQTLGGTGALYLSGLLSRHWTQQIAISELTWANHWRIFSTAGLKTEAYPYYKEETLQFESCMEKLRSLPAKTSVLLHANCHNPTGFDFSKEQWEELSQVFKTKNLFPIFDMAYQGLGNSLDEDAFAPRLFLEQGHELALTYTCAKNFSYCSERVGALFFVGHSLEKVQAVESHIKIHIRGRYSNPPFHGSRVVKTILQTAHLRKKWLEELEGMRQRIQAIRKQLAKALGNNQTILKGKGLFYYPGLSPDAIQFLREKKGLYVASDGRINVTGLSEKNFDLFVKAFLEAKKK